MPLATMKSKVIFISVKVLVKVTMSLALSLDRVSIYKLSTHDIYEVSIAKMSKVIANFLRDSFYCNRQAYAQTETHTSTEQKYMPPTYIQWSKIQKKNPKSYNLFLSIYMLARGIVIHVAPLQSTVAHKMLLNFKYCFSSA